MRNCFDIQLTALHNGLISMGALCKRDRQRSQGLRIGDHAVNIAEWVAFSITGEHKTQTKAAAAVRNIDTKEGSER